MACRAWRSSRYSAALTVYSGMGLAGPWQGVRVLAMSDEANAPGDNLRFSMSQVSNGAQ